MTLQALRDLYEATEQACEAWRNADDRDAEFDTYHRLFMALCRESDRQREKAIKLKADYKAGRVRTMRGCDLAFRKYQITMGWEGQVYAGYKMGSAIFGKD